MSGFAMWLATNCIWRNGSQDLWYSMRLKFGKDKTSSELAEMYQTRFHNKGMCGGVAPSGKKRDVSFPLSKKIMEQFNIPKDLKIVCS